MKKLKMKKKTMATFLVIASVIAGASLTAIIDSKSGFISDLIEERNCSQFLYTFEMSEGMSSIDIDTESNTVSKKIDITNVSPYQYVTLKATKYSDENMSIYYDEDADKLLFNNVSKLELTFKLKQNVEFYVNNIRLLCDYIGESHDNQGENELKVTGKIGRKSFNICDTSFCDILLNQNCYSDDVTITIINTRALKNELSSFGINDIGFNSITASSSYSAGVSGN